MARAQAGDIIVDMKPTFGHCAIVTGNWNMKLSASVGSTGVPGGLGVIHATSGGVIAGDWSNGRAYCFRARRISSEELKVIQEVAEAIQTGGGGGAPSTEYGACRAIFKSWSAPGKFGTGARARLDKYRERLGKDRQVLKNVFCSELVIVAYQLGLKVNEAHEGWIPLDGKHTLPGTLKRWFDANMARWQHMGFVEDASLALK
ncbi:hypothetical protein ACE7GA_23355 [Roseomonas sp. CCTCC AB2023176]|uniref:hypothetical protein n=1 Tax=Roseomonas sp. CCTCC AB2023176 TaxID=3342640 RepID=UPI0035DBABD3